MTVDVNGVGSPFQDMDVNHCGAHIFMTQKLLYRSDVRARLKHVGCKRMAQSMHRNMFGNCRLLDFRPTHIPGVAHGAVASMPTDEKPRPIQVCFLSLKAIVQVTNALANLVKQPNRA